MIPRHKLVDTNQSTTEKVYRDITKILRPFHDRVCCYQNPNPNEPEELTKFKFRSFDFLICLNKNNFVDKAF